MEMSRGMPAPGTRRPARGRARTSADADAAVIAAARWTRGCALVVAGLLLVFLIVGFVGAGALAPPTGQVRPSDHVALDIMPVKPGGPAEGFAAYLPSTLVRVPARTTVTFAIRNFDLDPAALPPGSSAGRVQGTVGGVAYADGIVYTALDAGGIAHTFAVPALGLNVPIPGHAATGRHYVTVTFRVRTGKAGAYDWRCWAPCGDGPTGQAGPMADAAYMRGTLFVEE